MNTHNDIYTIHSVYNNCLICQDQRTALMLAACSGSLEMVSLFLEKGADVNLRDKVGVFNTCMSPDNHMMTDSCAGRILGTHVC